MDNTKAFSLTTDVEGIVFGEKEVVDLKECHADEDMELKMRQLQKGAMKKELGQYLDDAQIDAILVRRDKLLELCGD